MTAMHDSDNHGAKLLQALGGLGVHAHLCLIYETREEQFAALVPFIRIGLERGERCVYIADDNTAAVVLDALAAQGLDVASAVTSGALMMASKRETYLQSGVFDPDLMIRFLHDAAEAAKAAGFAALRATGEMTWALGEDPGVERLMEYEAKLNDFFPKHEALAICQYNRTRFPPAAIRDVLRTHPLVIYGSVVCRNAFYVPPVEWFASDAASMEVTRLLDAMLARERDEEALRARVQQQAAVAQLGQRALAGADLSTLMDDTVGLVARTLDVEYVQIAELLPDGQALLLRAGVGWKEGAVGHATVGAGLESQAGYTLHVRESVIVEDLRSETRFTGPPLLREHGVISGLSTVIQGHARPFGVLSAHTASRRVFSGDDVHVLQAIAHVVATAVARKRMEEGLHASGQALRDVVDRQTVLLKDATETRKAMLGMLEDLNDTNVELRQAKKEWEDTFDAISDPLFIHDQDFNLIKANQAYAQLAGVPIESLLGRPYYDVFPKADGPLAMCRKALEMWQTTVEEVACPSINKCFNARFFPIKNADGQHLFSVHVMEDITERRAMETQARRLEQMAAMGQLLGGIAHELKNPLFILTGRLQLLGEKLAHREYDTLGADLQKIKDAACRMTGITERFLSFLKPYQPHGERCSVPAVLEQTLEFLANELMTHHIRVVRTIAPTLPETWSDPRQLHEVFLNLMLNAMQAMVEAHGQGTLTVAAALVDGWIEARIQDDGPGILPAHRAKLFDPFFSTKPSEQGTGLGLWTVRTILMQLKGTVACETEVGQGTTFIVRLPVQEPDGQAPAATGSRDPAPDGQT